MPGGRAAPSSMRIALACSHGNGQHVLTRRDGAIVERREGAGRVVGTVEIEGVPVAAQRDRVDVAADRIALAAGGGIAEEDRHLVLVHARLEQPEGAEEHLLSLEHELELPQMKRAAPV